MRTSAFLSTSKVVGFRRSLIAAMLAVLLAALSGVCADQASKSVRLAILAPSVRVPRVIEVDLEALRDLGYVEGRNLIFIERWAGGSEELLRRYAVELAEMKVDAMVVGTATGVRAAAAATRTIPIVAIDMESDPVANGWVASLARPGGNITGFFLDLPELTGKRLEQLKELIPGLSRVAILWDAIMDRTPLKAAEPAASTYGLSVVMLEVRGPTDFELAFRRAVRERVQAVLIWGSPLFDANAAKIAALAIQHRLPIAGLFPFHPEAGFLMSYGPDNDDLIRRCWVYVDRILKGEKPGDLPAQRPEKFLLVLNLNTASALGIRFPQSLLFQAHQVIK